jgi:GYF domain 2
MKYKIQRGINEYGPYTLADLQRYVAQGNILLTDLARSEGMTEWVPVSQIIGDIPAAPPPAAPTAAAGTVYSGAPATGAISAGVAYGVAQVPAVPIAGPVPPDLHWALVLLIGFFCGLFNLVWLFIEAGFVKKIRPQSNHLALIITGLAIQFGSIAAANSGSHEPPEGPMILLGVLVGVGVLGGAVVHIIGNFKMRSAMVEYYNTVEPINLRLSGVMTFFFPIFYFQYHFSRIAAWKRTGYLVPQQ